MKNWLKQIFLLPFYVLMGNITETGETPVNPEQTGGEPPEITAEVEGAEPSHEEDTTTAEPTADPDKEKKGIQKRFDQMTREKHEARAEAEYWRKVATGEIVPPKPQPIETVASERTEPRLDDYDDYDQYNRALVRFEAENILLERDKKEEQKKVVAQRQTVAEQNAVRVEAAKAQYADFDDVTANLNGIMVPTVTIEAMQESELSAELFYYLGNNIEEAKRLQTLSVPAQLREIGKIEAKLEKKPTPVKRVSQAPTPIKPVGGDGEPASVDPNKMTDDEWLAHERKRLAAKGRRY